jgi:hypothetical protein
MNMQVIIPTIGLLLIVILVILIYRFLTVGLENPPSIMSEQELLDEGMTKLEARRELRLQRAELRAHSRTLNQTVRTANQLSKTFLKLFK